MFLILFFNQVTSATRGILLQIEFSREFRRKKIGGKIQKLIILMFATSWETASESQFCRSERERAELCRWGGRCTLHFVKEKAMLEFVQNFSKNVCYSRQIRIFWNFLHIYMIILCLSLKKDSTQPENWISGPILSHCTLWYKWKL